MNKIEFYFLLFILYAIIGWMIEVTGKFIQKHKFINRGFLIGPYCPIYGYGALIITLLLSKYKDDLFALFIMGIFICSVLEYITSYAMEKIFKARWWDYSNYKVNLNGRICLNNSVLFGLGGIFIIKISNPILFKILENINGLYVNYIFAFLLLIYIIDNIISFKVINNFRLETYKLAGDSTELISTNVLKETKRLFGRVKIGSDLISKKVKEFRIELTNKLKLNLNNKNYLYKRLINAYPNLEARIKSNDRLVKEILEKIKERSDRNVAKFKRSTKKK